jgi:hypothetical protein
MVAQQLDQIAAIKVCLHGALHQVGNTHAAGRSGMQAESGVQADAAARRDRGAVPERQRQGPAGKQVAHERQFAQLLHRARLTGPMQEGR